MTPRLRTIVCVLAAALTAAPSALADEPTAATGGLLADLSAPALTAGPGDLLGNVVRFRGTIGPKHGGRAVEVQRRDAARGWLATATAIAAADGTFEATWRADSLGRFSLRTVVAGAAAQAAATTAGAATVQMTIFRPVRATWYGPGLYGGRTACGQRLTRRLVGVAHRTLPCGTPVELFLDGRTITAPVVDRGPFAHGAHYDLTGATAEALGMTSTRTIGVSPRRVAAPRTRRSG